MKLIVKILIHFLALGSFSQNTYTPLIPNRIDERRFVTINGIEQWVTMKGDSTKPVILFLHGGPGSPLSPYADAVYGNWEKDFILVQWDQRGTGRTFGRVAPPELTPEYLRSNPLTMDQIVNDGIELVEYLKVRLTKQMIILFGSSWGSELGAMMAIRRPDLFYAYVGHSQVVSPLKDLISAYEKVYRMAETRKDQQSIAILNGIGKPPYAVARNAGKLLRIIKNYERTNSIPPPDSWLQLQPGYDNDTDNQHRNDGDDYSFINYVGDSVIGIKSMMANFDLLRRGLHLKVPVIFIQGEEDILTPKEITKSYFDKVKAPKKQFILVPKAAHGFNQAVLDAQHKIMLQLAMQ